MTAITVCRALVALGVIVSTGCATQGAQLDANRAVAKSVFDDILSGGRFERARDLYAPDFVNHAVHRDVGLAEDQAAARGWRSFAPDLSVKPDRIVADGDLVFVLWTARGTNTGEGNGLPATGRHVEGRGMTLWRIENGKIKEEWSEFDQAELLRQLGLASGAAGAGGK